METTAKEVAKKTTSQKKEQPVAMSKFVDELLMKGGTLENIVKKAKAEAESRKVTTLSTKGQIVSHAKFRISRGMKIKIENDTVSRTK